MADIPEWYADFAAAVIAGLPRDIDEAAAREWVRNPAGLEQALRGSLLDASAPAAPAATGELKHDKRQEGWTLVEDVTEPARISGDSIELASFPESDQGFTLGDEMVELVQGIDAKLGQRHAEYLLDNPQEIPEDFQKNSLVFPGTIWLGRDGNHHVPCLTWSRGTWSLQFGILEAGVDSNDCYVRPRS